MDISKMDLGTLRQPLSVLLVFLLLALTLWKLRQPESASRLPWRRASRRAPSLEAVERLALTPQHMLHLVRVQGRDLVVATHPRGCAVWERTEIGLLTPSGAALMQMPPGEDLERSAAQEAAVRRAKDATIT